MNKVGGIVFISIITGISVFLFGIMLINFLGTEIDTARTPTNLDCDNSSISDGQALSCLMVDTAMPYFIIAVFSAVAALTVGRFLV